MNPLLLLRALRRRFPSRRERRIRLASEIVPPSRRTRVLVRSVLAAAIIAVTLFLFPLQYRFEPPDYLVGTIASEEIIAPFDFQVPKEASDLEYERAVAAESVLPIFTRRENVPTPEAIAAALRRGRREPWTLTRLQDSLRVRFTPPVQRLLASPDSARVLIQSLEETLGKAQEAGLVGPGDGPLLARHQRVRIRSADGDRTIPTYMLYDRRKLQEEASTHGAGRLGEAGPAAVVELTEAFGASNVAYDPQATERDRTAARGAVSPWRFSIQRGERIVDAHERITPEQGVILDALQHATAERSVRQGLRSWTFPILGRALLVALMLVLLMVFLRVTRPRVWRSINALSLIATVMILTLGIAAGIARTGALHPYLIPVTLTAVLLTLLVDEIVALVIVAWLSGIIGAVTGWGLPTMLLGFTGGTTAVFAVRQVTHRMQVYRSMLLVAIANVAAAGSMVLVESAPSWRGLLDDVLWAAGNAILYTALATLLLPAFEKIFDRVTNVSLLELSDLNRPIFKRMMIEANGTYHHSMVIGSLAEAAAEAVGANPLLARVGAYYHDIGKIAKSTYFGENLHKGSRNPHERLTPTMSSLILESHVREGLELAREIGLPRQVAAFIPEHQGTTLMQYFHQKALEQDPEVDERDYRYPGPKPQSRETAIVMLGDAAEATVRSMDDQSPMKIRAVLNRLFDLRLKDGQLDECGLTIADLAKIREAFTHVLTGVFHGRVKYQWQKDGGEEKLGGATQERVFYPELETGIGMREFSGTYAGSSHQARPES